jgi:hypothetical protein
MSSDHIEDSKTKVTLSGDDATLETKDSAFAGEVTHGVSNDSLDYKKLMFWSGLGIATVVIFVVALMFFSQFSFMNAQRNASATSSYYEITKLTEDAEAHLNSYGVVNLEEGVYRIPIEEAINKVATDTE